MFAAVVPGVCWFEDRSGRVYCLPARTAVPGAVALRPNGPGSGYLQLVLPSGTLTLDGRQLPLTPVAPPAGSGAGDAAEVPWRPERPQQGVVDLGQDWRMLFREARAFAPWGVPGPPFDEALRASSRALGPQTTLRAGPGRREVRYIYPQLVPAYACNRLAATFAQLPVRARCAAVVAEGELTLAGPNGCRATAGVDALGWRMVVRSATGDAETARRPQEAVALLASKGAVWEVAVPAARVGSAARSLILG